MWRHVVAVGKIIAEQSSRFWRYASLAAGAAALANKTLGKALFEGYEGFSAYWAVLPIVGLVGVALYRKVVDLEARISSKLEILTGSGDPFELEERDPTKLEVTYRRLLRIGVRNCGNETLAGCCVELTEMPGSRNAYLPIRLKLRHDNPPDVLNTSHIQEFDLRPGQTEYVDVANLNEANEQSEIRLCYATQGHRNLNYANVIPRGTYSMVIRAYGRNGSPAEATLKLWVDGNSRLRLDWPR